LKPFFILVDTTRPARELRTETGGGLTPITTPTVHCGRVPDGRAFYRGMALANDEALASWFVCASFTAQGHK
jgi:hypothetical protein